MRCIERGDWGGVATLMLSSAESLARGGADFLICPDNTIHQALPFVEPRSPLPWLHIARVVADRAAEHGFRRLGLTGTRYLVASEVYPEQLASRGIECVRPTGEEREEIDRIIMDELVHGVFTAGSGRILPAGDRAAPRRAVRRGRPRLHRDPAPHERRELAAADARLHASAGARGAAAGRAAARRKAGRVREDVIASAPRIPQPVVRRDPRRRMLHSRVRVRGTHR